MGLLSIITNGLFSNKIISYVRVFYPLIVNMKNKKFIIDIMNVKLKKQLNLNTINKSLKIETKKFILTLPISQKKLLTLNIKGKK